jgi:hypothetical protein
LTLYEKQQGRCSRSVKIKRSSRQHQQHQQQQQQNAEQNDGTSKRGEKGRAKISCMIPDKNKQKKIAPPQVREK